MKVSLFALALAAVVGFSSADKASFYDKDTCSGTPDDVISLPGCYNLPEGSESLYLECSGGEVEVVLFMTE
jgi:hypothetical protein